MLNDGRSVVGVACFGDDRIVHDGERDTVNKVIWDLLHDLSNFVYMDPERSYAKHTYPSLQILWVCEGKNAP